MEGNDLVGWLRKHQTWLCFLFFLAVFSFAYELFNFNLSLDDEWEVDRASAYLHYLNISRWGMYLLHWVMFPNVLVPFSSLFLALISTTLSFTIVCRLFSSERGLSDYWGAPFYVAFPSLYYIFHFNTAAFAVGIGFLLGATSIYFWFCGKGVRRYLAFPILVFTISIYPAFISWSVTLVLAYLLGRVMDSEGYSFRQFLREFVGGVALVTLSIIGFKLIDEAIVFFCGVDKSSYLDNYVNYEMSFSYLYSTIQNILINALEVYWGSEELFHLKQLSVLIALFFLSVLLVSTRILFVKSRP